MAITKQNTRIQRITITPVYNNGTGTYTAPRVEALLETAYTDSAEPAKIRVGSPLDAVQFDLLDPLLKDLSVAVAGVTGLTNLKLAAGIRTTVLTQANAGGIT